LLVGAAQCFNIDTVKLAVDSGATFVVTPGLNPTVVSYAWRIISDHPGACTPTEIEAAMDLGLSLVKFFPAEAMGGLKTIQAIAGAYSKMSYMPTGGITPAKSDFLFEIPEGGCLRRKWIVSVNFWPHATMIR